MRQLQLANSANWELAYSQDVSAAQIAILGGGVKIVPIPEQTIPLLFDKHILAVFIDTTVPEGRKWFFGGNLYQKFQIGVVVGGQPDASNIGRRRLELGKVQLVIFPKLTPTYSISIAIPPWFTRASIRIWEYSGIDFDSVELGIERIEQKLDFLTEGLIDPP